MIPVYGDGSSRRDYTYIDDIVEGVIGAVRNLRGYDIFNLGESRTVPLRDLISLLEGALDIEFMLQSPNSVFHKESPVKNTLYEEYYYTEGEIVRPINWHAEKTGYRIVTVES